MTDLGAPGKRSASGPHATSMITSDRSRRRSARPLLGVFPLAVMAVATFMVIFTLMVARLTAGADPALQSAGASALVEAAVQGHTLSTRTSGSTSGAAAPASVATAGSATAAVMSRSSGAGGATGGARED